MASIPSQTLPAAQPHRAGKLKKISLIPFIAILYAYCAGGPFDYEAMVSTSGPGMALLFILIVPWLFSVPMALASAEMAQRCRWKEVFIVGLVQHLAISGVSNAAGGTGLGHSSCGPRMEWCWRITSRRSLRCTADSCTGRSPLYFWCWSRA